MTSRPRTITLCLVFTLISCRSKAPAIEREIAAESPSQPPSHALPPPPLPSDESPPLPASPAWPPERPPGFRVESLHRRPADPHPKGLPAERHCFALQVAGDPCREGTDFDRGDCACETIDAAHGDALYRALADDARAFEPVTLASSAKIDPPGLDAVLVVWSGVARYVVVDAKLLGEARRRTFQRIERAVGEARPP